MAASANQQKHSPRISVLMDQCKSTATRLKLIKVVRATGCIVNPVHSAKRYPIHFLLVIIDIGQVGYLRAIDTHCESLAH